MHLGPSATSWTAQRRLINGVLGPADMLLSPG